MAEEEDFTKMPVKERVVHKVCSAFGSRRCRCAETCSWPGRC